MKRSVYAPAGTGIEYFPFESVVLAGPSAGWGVTVTPARGEPVEPVTVPTKVPTTPPPPPLLSLLLQPAEARRTAARSTPIRFEKMEVI